MLRGLKLAFTVGMFLLIAGSVDLSRTIQLLRGAAPALLGAAFAMLAAQVLLVIARWRWILFLQGLRFDFFRLVRFYWLGLFFNQVLPSSVGGDAMRAYCLVRDGCGIGAASVAVLLDRILGLLGLILLVFVCQPMSFEFLHDGATRWGVLFVALGAAAAVCALLILDRLTGRFRHWRIAQGMTMLSGEARRILFSLPHGALLLVLSVAVHLISILAVGVLALGLDIGVHWLAFAIVVPLASLLMAVPISIAGWGVREGVMVVGLGYAGIPPEQAVALSVLYGLLLLAVALPGGLAWLADGRRHPQEERG
ncbi:MAG: flippase-like domain-containing protein [Betaproteobacteria bacterium]|nr:flippase-like domain-containing protein [Betaproteobacteria bacterium]